MYKKLILNFIKEEFPVKKTKHKGKRWTNAIIIPEGYLRNTKKAIKPILKLIKIVSLPISSKY